MNKRSLALGFLFGSLLACNAELPAARAPQVQPLPKAEVELYKTEDGAMFVAVETLPRF